MKKEKAYQFDIPETSWAFDAITTLFEFQHAGENDVACYRRASALLRSGSLLLNINQCFSGLSGSQKNRDIGEMRIFSKTVSV